MGIHDDFNEYRKFIERIRTKFSDQTNFVRN